MRFRFPRFRIFAVLFQYQEEPNLKAYVETSPDLSGNVMQVMSLA
jgi:hypothetical protein